MSCSIGHAMPTMYEIKDGKIKIRLLNIIVNLVIQENLNTCSQYSFTYLICTMYSRTIFEDGQCNISNIQNIVVCAVNFNIS